MCGAGINCVGVAPDGRHARFPSLGAITGDWGGGYDVGLEALFAAARSEDGRGPKTSLESSVPAHFELASPPSSPQAIHAGRIAERRVIELAPLVLEQAPTDAVAGAIVDRLAAEVAALARVALTRLDLQREPVEVLLGGGLLQTASDGLMRTIAAALAETGPQITVRSTRSPAIVGAALLGLDALDAKREAQERLRRGARRRRRATGEEPRRRLSPRFATTLTVATRHARARMDAVETSARSRCSVWPSTAIASRARSCPSSIA